MTVLAPLVFPGSRALAGWWRQLAPWQPRHWWVGHLLLHRVEALATFRRTLPLDPLHRFVLRALTAGATLDALDERLHLGRQFLCRLTTALQAEGLTRSEAGVWSLTDVGRQTLEKGEQTRTTRERRPFTFIEPDSADGPLQFLSVERAGCLPWPAGPDWSFDPALLSPLVAQSQDWKRRRGFPTEIGSVLAGTDADVPDWQRVVVDSPERLPVALVRTRDDRLLGFAVCQDDWSVQSEKPAFSLDAGWPEVFPSLAESIPEDRWRQAWQTWCQPRGLAGFGTEACLLEPEGHLLRVAANPRLLERLRQTRSDVFKGEAWVLAGEGRLRAAVLLDVVEERSRAG